MLLTAKVRPDLVKQGNKTFYINGTFYYKDKSLTIKNKSTHTKNKKEADKYIYDFIETLKAKINEGRLDKPPTTYDQACEKKLQDTDSPPSDGTIKKIEKTRKYLGNYVCNQITNLIIKEKSWEAYPFKEEYKYLKNKAYSDLDEMEKRKKSSHLSTINTQFITGVSTVLHYANEIGLCNYLKIKRFSLITRDPLFFEEEEVNKCLSSTNFFQTKLLLVFLIYAGARLQEALNCKWENINFERNTIWLWEGKGDKGRIIYIHETLREWLMKVNDKGQYVFMWRTKWDHKKDNNGLYFNWHTMLMNAKVNSEKTPHKCRHTFATWLRNYAQCKDQDIQDIGGWKSQKSMNGYSHIMPQIMPEKIKLLPKVAPIYPQNENKVIYS